RIAHTSGRLTFDCINVTMARLPPAICDDCVAAVSLPFAFNFVGTDYANNCNQLQRNPHLQHGRPERCNTNYNWGRMNSATVSLTLMLSVQATAGAKQPNPLIASWFEDL